MLEKLKHPGSRCVSGRSIRTAIASLTAILLAAIVLESLPAAAATVQANRSSDDKARWIKICKADIQRFCDEANLKQECLIAHWSKISTECQEVLGSSAGNRAGDGS